MVCIYFHVDRRDEAMFDSLSNMPGAGMRIIETGIALPETILTNADIKRHLNPDIDISWVEDKLGIFERRIVKPGQLTSDLAAEAGKRALERADLGPEQIDLLVLATATPDCQAPATACITQAKLGLVNATAFDVSAVCSGFLFAMVTAASFIQCGRAHRALVIGADAFSQITDWKRRDCVFFGDGAGAVILERSQGDNSVFDARLYSDGTQHTLWHVNRGQHFEMDAQGIFKQATHALPLCIQSILSRNNITKDQIDMVVPHQPSINLLRAISNITGVPFSKFQMNIGCYGNTASATIPIVLHETIEKEAIRPGDMLLFAAAGAGFTAGAALYRWH